jgi:hypothetical protein
MILSALLCNFVAASLAFDAMAVPARDEAEKPPKRSFRRAQRIVSHAGS